MQMYINLLCFLRLNDKFAVNNQLLHGLLNVYTDSSIDLVLPRLEYNHTVGTLRFEAFNIL